MSKRLWRVRAAVVVALSTLPVGCVSVAIKDWKNARPGPSYLTAVEGRRISPTLIALHVTDTLSERDYAWVHGAWPTGAIAQVLSRSTASPLQLKTHPEAHHSELLLLARRVSWPHSEGEQPDLQIIDDRSEASESTFLVRIDDRLELWSEGERRDTVVLPTGLYAERSATRKRIGDLLFPVALMLDLVTSPIQGVVLLAYLVAGGSIVSH